MHQPQTQSKYRLSCDDLNWTIQKLESNRTEVPRWRTIRWYADNLLLCARQLQHLQARELFNPDKGLQSLIEALDGSKWLVCEIKATELIKEGRYLRPTIDAGPRGATPRRGMPERVTTAVQP